ncbi:hypothetical protein BH10ACT10_BH10ACT10_27280 [soil metagenome]
MVLAALYPRENQITLSPRLRRTLPGLLGSLALVLGLLVAGPAATAHPGQGHGHGQDHGQVHGRKHGQQGYLALGDSVPFGYRPGAVTTPAQYADESSFVGYPELLARRSPLRVTNASCAGETTASMISVTAQSNGCTNSLTSPFGYRDAYPLHTAYASRSQSQLDFAVAYLRSHRNTRLVTLMIGANDLFVCQKTTASQCTSAADFGGLLAQVSTNLDRILSTLRTDGGYAGAIDVVSYYSLDYTDPLQTGGIQALNAAIASVATSDGAAIADGFGSMKDASEPSLQPCTAGLLIALPTGGCDVHPTRTGQAALARAVAEVSLPSHGHQF